ncbi:MAG: 50S ribosomal protein L25 [Candidatus Brocadiaceae bacterium]|jgi:large subunit ribosomal protein L25
MQIAQIEARPREVRGTRACRRLRNQGLVPAVIYGRDEPNVLLTLRHEDIDELMESHAFVVEVQWDGQQENAQIKEVQYGALGDEVMHVDLVRISLTEKVTVGVPVEPHGDAAGVAEGGIQELVLHEVEVECLPTAIPEQIRVEVEELEIGDNLTVADLEFPVGVEPVTDPETVVVTVVPPAELEEEEEEPEELLLEPELIGREAEEEPGEEVEFPEEEEEEPE